MNVSVAPPGSQVYVEISPLSTHISSSNNVEDVHICGSCKRNFSVLHLFVEHKRAGCPASTQKTLSTVAPTYNQSSLGYVTANTTNTNEDGISSLGSQYLRVILDNDHLNIQGNESQNPQLSSSIHCPTNSDHQILRARLLGVTEQDTSVGNQPDFQNTNDLDSLVLEQQQHQEQSNTKQREFQIDEEDVATLLANQLTSEVVNSVHETSIVSKTGLINITHELVPKTQNHFDLESINLPDESNENIVLKVENCKSSIKGGASKNYNSNSVTSGNLKWTNRNTGICNKNNVPVSISSSETGMINNRSKNSSLVTSQISSSENVVVDGPTGKIKHKCTQDSCDFTTWYPKDLIRHERKHTGERPFQCFSCHRSFSRLDKLHMHERIHTGDKRYQCEICAYATHDSGSLRKHMRIHNDERPYKCQMCPYRSRDSSQLTVHLRTHTGDNPFVCAFENCTSAFKTSSDLKRHSRTHTGEKPFSCSFCQYKCAIKSNLRVHIRLTHSEMKTCSICSYVASTKREFKDHEKTHAGDMLKCGLCSFTCANSAGMKSHCKIHEQDKLYSCKFCSFMCRLPASLKTHVKKKHSETFRKKHKAASKDGPNESLRNQASNRSGNSKGSIHLKPFCVKSHKCTYCDAAFVREDSWRSHMRQHKNSLSSVSLTSSSAVPPSETSSKDSSNNDFVVTSNSSVNLEGHSEHQNQETDDQKCDLISTEYLILSNNSDALKDNSKFITSEQPDESAGLPTDSGIETSFVQYSLEEKSDKEQVPVIHQLTQDVLEGDSLQNQPILLYVQNAPVLHSGLDSNLRNAEIVASLNQSAPILVAGRCSQFLSLEQGGSLVEQFSPLPQGMQYIVSAPFESVVGNNATYIQPLETTDSSGNAVSVVSFQVDKGSVLTTQEGSN